MKLNLKKIKVKHVIFLVLIVIIAIYSCKLIREKYEPSESYELDGDIIDEEVKKIVEERGITQEDLDVLLDVIKK
jgi:hypothetical protein